MIHVSNLNFSYKKSQKKAIHDMNFEISKGEVFGFLGPNGAGKTTTQRLIIGLLRNYSGYIKVLGRERREWDKEFYEHIGVSFDFPNLYNKLTAKENLQLIGAYYKRTKEDIDYILDVVGLLNDKNTCVENFSKGMKMRLNFVRAIMHKPDLMFFDEPTSGLDPVNAHIIKDLILKQKQDGKTVFLTTHNMTVAEQLCDRVALIVDGNIVVIDSAKNLMVKHGRPLIRVEYKEDGKITTREFNKDGIGNNTEFLNIIQSTEINTIHSCEATLEDVFIKLTGRNLQ